MSNGHDNVDNIVLEHLRALRSDNADFKHRLANLEESTATGFSAVLRNGAKAFAGLNRRFDRLEERIDRLDERVARFERRTDSSDASY